MSLSSAAISSAVAERFHRAVAYVKNLPPAPKDGSGINLSMD
jgi:hypothetical protein